MVQLIQHIIIFALDSKRSNDMNYDIIIKFFKDNHWSFYRTSTYMIFVDEKDQPYITTSRLGKKILLYIYNNSNDINMSLPLLISYIRNG